MTEGIRRDLETRVENARERIDTLECQLEDTKAILKAANDALDALDALDARLDDLREAS